MVYLVNMISIRYHKLDQKVLKKFSSLSKIMVQDIPKLTETCSKKILSVDFTMILFSHGVKMTIIDNRLKIIIIKTYNCYHAWWRKNLACNTWILTPMDFLG